MDDEKITDGADPKDVDPTLAALIGNILDKRDAVQRTEMTDALEELAKPERKAVAAVLPTTERKPDAVPGRVEVRPHSDRQRAYRDLYKKSPPAIRECRTEEQDFWNHRWLLGMLDKNVGVMREAMDKSDAAYLRGFGVQGWNPEQRADAGTDWGQKAGQRAAILEGAVSGTDLLDGSGGSLLPQGFTAVLSIAREQAAVIEGLAMVYPMTSATLRIPLAGTATSAKVAEGGTPANGESSYASLLLKAEKNTVFMESSREFIADSAFNAVSLFGERAGSALGAGMDVDLLTTDGVAPNATEALSGEAVAEATPTVLVYPDLNTLYRNVSKTDRRSNCAWLGDSQMLGFLDNMLDGNGRPILTDPGAVPQSIGDSPGNEGFIKRFPVFEVPSVTGDLIFGNIRQGYAIGRREGITARVSTDAAFKTGLVQFLIEERYDGLLQEAAAIKELQGITSVA